ncbi:MAG: hypothetical protein Q8L47_01230 [bacterium]|nr:hypothetical protein [bacterium]
MLKMMIAMAVSLSLLGFPKPAIGSLFDCSKGLNIQAFSPQGFITKSGVYSARNFGYSIYLDLKTGLKCRVYSSRAGKIYFQIREQGDGTNTSWVVQKDHSYSRYNGAHIAADFDINTDDTNNKVIVIFIKLVDDKNPFAVKDTFTFTFLMITLRNI